MSVIFKKINDFSGSATAGGCREGVKRMTAAQAAGHGEEPLSDGGRGGELLVRVGTKARAKDEPLA